MAREAVAREAAAREEKEAVAREEKEKVEKEARVARDHRRVLPPVQAVPLSRAPLLVLVLLQAVPLFRALLLDLLPDLLQAVA